MSKKNFISGSGTLRPAGLQGLWAVLTILVVLASALPAGAIPQIMSTYGDQTAWAGADINAMGGTGVALYRGGMSSIFNPALLAREKGYRLDGSLLLEQDHEDRFQPLFDSFNSFVVDAAIASNRHHFWQTGFGFAGRLLKDSHPVVVGLSLADRYPFSYTFDEELRNPSPFPPGNGDPARDTIIEQREHKVSGTLRDLSLGVGTDLMERVSLGASVHYAFGTRTDVSSSRDRDGIDPDNSYRNEDEFDMDGVNFTVGATGVLSERLTVGLAWESRLTADGDWTHTEADPSGVTIDTHDGKYRYPNMYRAGVVFRPRTDPVTVFTVDVEYKPWSNLEDSENPGSNPRHLQDVTDVRIGLQHTFYNGIPLRFGFRHFNSYADRDAGASIFSTGVGAPLGTGMLSASLELTKVTSNQLHQFPYPASYFGDNFETDPMARVEDTRFRIGVGYKMEF